jgi:hypothetical protein
MKGSLVLVFYIVILLGLSGLAKADSTFNAACVEKRGSCSTVAQQGRLPWR